MQVIVEIMETIVEVTMEIMETTKEIMEITVETVGMATREDARDHARHVQLVAPAHASHV